MMKDSIPFRIKSHDKLHDIINFRQLYIHHSTTHHKFRRHYIQYYLIRNQGLTDLIHESEQIFAQYNHIYLFTSLSIIVRKTNSIYDILHVVVLNCVVEHLNICSSLWEAF